MFASRNTVEIFIAFLAGKSHHLMRLQRISTASFGDICPYKTTSILLSVENRLRRFTSFLKLNANKARFIFRAIQLTLLSWRKQKSILPAVCSAEIIPHDLSDATNESKWTKKYESLSSLFVYISRSVQFTWSMDVIISHFVICLLAGAFRLPLFHRIFSNVSCATAKGQLLRIDSKRFPKVLHKSNIDLCPFTLCIWLFDRV